MKKQIVKAMLAGTLLLSSFAPLATTNVFAAENGTITIKDTEMGQTYSSYKIFDATVNGSAVSYTLPSTSPLLNNQGLKDLFNLESNGDLTYIVKKESVSDSQITAWAQGLDVSLLTATDSKTENNDTTETLTVPYGYYIVKSTLNQGSVVMVSSTTPNATINEKNSQPSWGGGSKKTDKGTYNVGDTIKYTINYESATNYDKGEKVYNYVVKDIMPGTDVVTLDPNSIVVKVGGTTLQAGNGTDINTYKIELDGNNFTITIPWAATQTPKTDGTAEDFFYTGINPIVVEYNATLKSGAKEGSAEAQENTNTATVNPNSKTKDPGKKAQVYDGSITINKVDAKDQATKLDGAKFILQNEAGNYYHYDEASDKITWVAKDQATVIETKNGGKAEFSGLAEGTYKLIETEAPKGYNLIKEPKEVVLKKDADLSDNDDTLLVTTTVENKAGAQLPSTGGMGTTIIYVVGGLLIVGAGVTLVARRRLQA